jgi:tRNA-modifying protein YgfZ
VAILDPVAVRTADTDGLSTSETEYRVLTTGCGLIDRSERGKLALTGGEAKEFLAGQVTNDIQALTSGTGCYAAFLTPKGKMLGDLRVLSLSSDGLMDPDSLAPEGELFLDTERATLQALFDMIRRFKIGYDVQLHKRTLERGLISLIGPDSVHIAEAAKDLSEEEHANASVRIDGISAIAVRTDTGVDLICDAADTDALIHALRQRGAIRISEDAAEIVRVEHGRPRYGIDLDDTVIPQEAGLNERAVSFTKGCYVGQETVARLYYKGKPNRHLRGLRLSEAVPAGAELYLGERVVGQLTSSVLSPDHGQIGLGLVRREAEPGMRVSIGAAPVNRAGADDRGPSAKIVELPFRQTAEQQEAS